MIISASRRTDIPAFYGDWFVNRIKEGYVYVRNPINKHQISKVNLSCDVVDCIVFWSKNPKNILNKLKYLNDYKYYFQFTLTCYDNDIEYNLPPKKDIIETFKELSLQIGRDKVIWRYDPIFLSRKYTLDYHLKSFDEISTELSGYTDKVIISFIDMYKKILPNVNKHGIRELNKEEIELVASRFAKTAKRKGLYIETCAEKYNLSGYGIEHGQCIDINLIENICGYKIKCGKDYNQRKECGCIQSIDIGAYDTCTNYCAYCYANYNKDTVEKKCIMYNKNSKLLCDVLKEEDKIVERKVSSLKDGQLSIFD
ncbi:DUF1848 domain-containing protein [Anaerofustis sp.]|uniref:DUF1848 domain-containing protein n=1 Tax=Anaerofustis sp. TaxID=1872517 RepID=UPI0025C58F60|nr:DUF1848 domain-containing protein [Anaerofustis sp.]